MASVGMIGKNGREMARVFLRLCQGMANCYHITEEQHLGPKLDIVVATEATPILAEIVPKMAAGSYLVVNADDKEIFPYLSPRSARLITYGFNNKACVTASSVTDEGLHICIQRSFTTLDGKTQDPQEFAAPVDATFSPETALGAAAAYAICGKI